MTSVAEIQQAIGKLSRREFVELEQRFDAERNRKWDRQIAEDVQSGKLREVYERLTIENQGQADTPLDKFAGEHDSKAKPAQPRQFSRARSEY